MGHTKWFWELCDTHNDGIERQLLRVKDSTDIIACVEFIHGETAERKANACKMAAVPDLLAACEGITKYRDKAGYTQITQKEWDDLRAAVAATKS